MNAVHLPVRDVCLMQSVQSSESGRSLRSKGRLRWHLNLQQKLMRKSCGKLMRPADGESDPDEEKKEPEDRLIMKTGSLIKYF